MSRMAVGLGVEPRFTGSEPVCLPLADPTILPILPQNIGYFLLKSFLKSKLSKDSGLEYFS